MKGRIQANNDEMLRSMVLHDLGIGYGYSSLFTSELKNGRVVSLLEPYLKNMSADVYALYPQMAFRPYKIDAFLQVVAEQDSFSTQ